MESPKGIKTPPSQKVVGGNMFFPQEDILAVKDSDSKKDEMDINAKTAMNFRKKKEVEVDEIEQQIEKATKENKHDPSIKTPNQ